MQIGTGGFATLFEVTSGTTSYALKRLAAQTQEDRAAGEREIEALKAVSHPNVISLVASDQTESWIWILLPMIAGGSLGDRLADPSFTPTGCARVAQELVAATGAVHGAGLGHRDINIYNIMFNSSGSLVLIDLGSTTPLELPVADRQQISAVQEAAEQRSMATYRAPELHDPYRASEQKVDGRADVFSIGAVLFAYAFGHNPFESPTQGFMKLLLLQGKVEFPADRTFRDVRIGDDVCDIITKCCTEEPSQRMTLAELAVHCAALN